MAKAKFISALRYRWLTPAYDFLIEATMPEQKIKQSLIDSAYLTDGAIVLDFGCGTATLTIMSKEQRPAINISGIDIDKAILKKATEKVNRKQLEIKLMNYDGERLPFENNSFDRIISCLVFHHLNTPVKQTILLELFRVTKSNGQLFIADFGRSDSWLQRSLFNLIRGLDGYEPTNANANGVVPQLISEAGFENVEIKKRFKTMFGEVQIISAEKINTERLQYVTETTKENIVKN